MGAGVGHAEAHHDARVRGILFDLRLDNLDDQPAIICLAGDAARLEHLEDLDGMHKSGGLDQDDIARFKVELADQVHAFDAAGDDQHIFQPRFQTLGRQQPVDDGLA